MDDDQQLIPGRTRAMWEDVRQLTSPVKFESQVYALWRYKCTRDNAKASGAPEPIPKERGLVLRARASALTKNGPQRIVVVSAWRIYRRDKQRGGVLTHSKGLRAKVVQMQCYVCTMCFSPELTEIESIRWKKTARSWEC